MQEYHRIFNLYLILIVFINVHLVNVMFLFLPLWSDYSAVTQGLIWRYESLYIWELDCNDGIFIIIFCIIIVFCRKKKYCFKNRSSVFLYLHSFIGLYSYIRIFNCVKSFETLIHLSNWMNISVWLLLSDKNP